MTLLKVAITGGIGSGKSFVAKIFEVYGIPVYYADKEAKRLMYRSQELKAEIKMLLGKEAYYRNGRLNRGYIAGLVFNNKALLKKLNGLVHPAVKKDFVAWSERQKAPYVLEEAAIVFEIGSDKNFDKVILVVADKAIKVERLKRRDGSDEAAINSRMKNQWSDKKKLPLADYVVENNGPGTQSLIKQIDRIHKDLVRQKK